MQEHIYSDQSAHQQSAQPAYQYTEESTVYPHPARNQDGPFEQQPHTYEPVHGYRGGPQEAFVPLSGFVPPVQQQIVYVPVYPTTFHSQESQVDGKILAALSYVGFWFTGLLMLLFVRENRFIRFHAVQSLLFFGGVMSLYIIAPFAFMPFWDITELVPIIAFLGFLTVTLVAAIAWFVGLIGALTGKCFKLPLAGDLAELWIKPHETAGTVK
jgi:uncharacterized membrane protein